VRDLALLLVHVLVTLARLVGPGVCERWWLNRSS